MPRPLGDLLRDGTLDSWTAAHLWAALARRCSVAVVAGPSGVGKTTLLTSLLDLLPADTRRIYLRGCFETFAFLDDPAVDPGKTALLVNELSPHLPVYLWGSGVETLLRATARGCTLLATAHAESATGFIRLLVGSPLRLSPQLVAALEYVVVLDRDPASASGRRVCGIWRLQATRSGITIAELPPPPGLTNSSRTRSQDMSGRDLFPATEIAERCRALIALRDEKIASLPAIPVSPEGSTGAISP